jgi:formylglycine-generating enzyme required for sulfatase activity
MKYFLLTFLIALTATVSSNAQTLQIDPIYIGGTAAFEVQGGTPGGVAIVCYSINGTGPFTLANGLSLDLSMPIRQLSPMVLNGIGDGYLGPFPTPSSAIVGMQVWFQAVDVNIWGSQILSATNMVPITVQNIPNNPPTAVDDNASTPESVTVTIDVMANDSDPDGDTISLVSLTAPTNGSAVIANGQIEYTPPASYIGADTFTYTIEDSFAAQATATVYMDVVVSGTTDMVAIPGGTFEMGDHAGVGGTDERPIHSVTLDAFFMDKYEVSNTKFADFLNNSAVTVSGSDVYQVGGAGQRICVLDYGLNHNGSTFVIDAGKDHHPVVHQTWYGAALYCNYLSTLDGRTPCYDETTFACDFTADGFRLPTEAEWEYASRGGEHSPYYQYPWGSDTITSADANYDHNIDTTVDVGSYAANGYGLYDMAGNVWEWCNDWHDGSYYSNSPATNPTGPASGSYRVIRGGSWYDSAIYLRCASRTDYNPTYYYNSVGFRVLAVQ